MAVCRCLVLCFVSFVVVLLLFFVCFLFLCVGLFALFCFAACFCRLCVVPLTGLSFRFHWPWPAVDDSLSVCGYPNCDLCTSR